MFFKVGDRVLVRTSHAARRDHIGTIITIDSDMYTVKIDEDHSEHIVPKELLMFVREDIRTDPSSCNGLLICKNCGWSGGHVWFAPHYCQNPATRDGKIIVKNSQVFEAHVITPLPAKRPNGTWIDREFIDAMKNFNEDTFKNLGK